MKLEKSSISTTMGNVEEVGDFKIKTSAIAFDILSSGLYANKIKAIIRELSCNAYDAQIAAGNGDTPFDIHLPTFLEPTFYIRDYGVGLSHDQVVNIFTTYFESTKSDSNDFVGAMGLGSKAPFSYTSNFTIEAFQNGICNVYTAFINDAGFPSVIRMETRDTEEPNGLKITVPVQEKDFRNFKSEAIEVFQWFKTVPNEVNDEIEFTKAEMKSYYDIDNIFVRADATRYHSYSYTLLAVMGNIAYPVDLEMFTDMFKHVNENSFNNFVFKFEIGDIEFSASRESLSYTQKTIDAIKQKIQYVFDNTEQLIQKQLDEGEDNMYSRIDKYNTLINTGDKFSTIIARTMFEKDKSFPSHVSKNDMYHKVDVVFPINERVTEYLAENFNCEFDFVYHVPHPNNRKIDFNSREDIVFFNYSTKGIKTHVKKYFTKKEYRSGYGESRQAIIVLPVDKTKPVDFDGIRNWLGNPPEGCIMTNDDLDIDVTERTYSVQGNVFTLEVSDYYDVHSWKEISEDTLKSMKASKNVYYINLSGYQLKDDFSFVCNNESPKSIYKTLESLGCITSNDVIIGVRKSAKEATQDIINLADHATTYINNLTDDDFLPMCSTSFSNLFIYHSDENSYPDDIKPIVEKYKTSHIKKTNYKSYNKKVLSHIDNATTYVEKIERKYKLIDSVSVTRYNVEHLLMYLHLINNTGENNDN